MIKTRYLVPLDGGLTAEVDDYEGALDGLLTAEVEFPDEAAAHAFDAPAWLGEDVTGDKRYANRALAVDGIALADLLGRAHQDLVDGHVPRARDDVDDRVGDVLGARADRSPTAEVRADLLAQRGWRARTRSRPARPARSARGAR